MHTLGSRSYTPLRLRLILETESAQAPLRSSANSKSEVKRIPIRAGRKPVATVPWRDMPIVLGFTDIEFGALVRQLECQSRL
jgi:hypothetical protein